MKIEFNRKRILFEAETSEEEELIQEILEASEYVQRLREVFLGPRPPKQEAEVTRKVYLAEESENQK